MTLVKRLQEKPEEFESFHYFGFPDSAVNAVLFLQESGWKVESAELQMNVLRLKEYMTFNEQGFLDYPMLVEVPAIHGRFTLEIESPQWRDGLKKLKVAPDTTLLRSLRTQEVTLHNPDKVASRFEEAK